MKIQGTVLLFCITMVTAIPNCTNHCSGRSPLPCCNRSHSRGQVQTAEGIKGMSGNDTTLQTALRSRRLTTLLSLIETADLARAITSDDDLTVLAPTNEALQTFIDSLPSAPNETTIRKVLLNHIISGKILSGIMADLDGKQAENLDGNQMTVRVNPKTLENPTGISIGGARIKQVDMPILRLTVHILDDVINPFELGTMDESLKGLRLTTLLSLLKSADLIEALSSSDNFTLFAPTNDAIARFIDRLPLAPNAETMRNVLLNHVISGKVETMDISDSLTVKNLAGNEMTFRVTNSGVTIGGASIAFARTDIPIRRVTLHVLDDVINPANLQLTLSPVLSDSGYANLEGASQYDFSLLEM